MRIAFTTELPKEGFRRLAERGLVNGDALLNGGLINGENGEWRQAEVLVSTFYYKVTREMIEAMPNL